MSPPLRRRVTTGLDRLSREIARRFEVDLRALAAFRIALGALVIADLALRSRDLVAFYTDAGVLPREALFADYGTVYTLHAVSGEPWFQALLFALSGAVALALVVGYRTRTATVVTWLLLVSLHARNPVVLNGGDVLLRMLLFWGMFLPLGERWAVDAARRDRSRSRRTEPGRTVASVGTMAVLLQVVLVYATNAIHKVRGDMWTAGEAVVYIFQADHFTILLGDVLAGNHALLELFTYLWMAAILASPLLVLLTGLPRAAFASVFVGMHLGMAFTLRIDLFPLISIAGLLPFYPPAVWDAVSRLADGTGLADRLRSARTRARRGLPTGSLTETLLVSRSAVPIPAGVVGRTREACFTLVPFVFVALVVASNAAAVDYAAVPEPAEEALDTVHADQSWRMFAPNPTRTTKWFAAPATLENGSEIDALHRSQVDLDRPEQAQDAYPTSRWRKYLTNAESDGEKNHSSYLGNYLCDRWNRQHDTAVEEVTVIYLYERTDPYDGTNSSGEVEFTPYDCSGDLVQSGTLSAES